MMACSRGCVDSGSLLAAVDDSPLGDWEAIDACAAGTCGHEHGHGHGQEHSHGHTHAVTTEPSRDVHSPQVETFSILNLES